jgi:hypothetical protein
MLRQRPKRPVNIPLRRRSITTVDLILGVIAAKATALLLALIARDAWCAPAFRAGSVLGVLSQGRDYIVRRQRPPNPL